MSKKLLKYNEFREDLFESVIKRGKDYKLFNYNSAIQDMWNPVMKEAQKFQKINFDMENDDTVESKTIFFDQLLRKDQPVKTEINLELRVAGGDWERPVYYFRIEFTHDHFISSNKSNPPEYVWDLKREGSMFFSATHKYILIPGADEGNFLYKTDKGYTAYTDDTALEDGLKEKDTYSGPERSKELWKWIETLMEELSEKRHKRLDEDDDGSNKPELKQAEKAK